MPATCDTLDSSRNFEPARSFLNSFSASIIKAQAILPITFLILVCFMAAISTPAFCQGSSAYNDLLTSSAGIEGYSRPDLSIEDIAVDGNRLIPTDQILNAVKLKTGDKFDREKVLQALKEIARMGYFHNESLQAVPELTNKGGILVKFKVQETPPITEFVFHGNSIFTTEELEKLFRDQLGKPQNLTDLATAIDKVEQSYRERGYALARVTDVKDDPDGSIHLLISEIDNIDIAPRDKKLEPWNIQSSNCMLGEFAALRGIEFFRI